jgi:hypothetical protein
MQADEDGLTNIDRHNSNITDISTPGLNVAHDHPVVAVEETPDFKNTMNQRIFNQFVKDPFDQSEIG